MNADTKDAAFDAMWRFLAMLEATVDSAAETGHTEAQVIAGNWDVMQHAFRRATDAMGDHRITVATARSADA